VKFIENILNYSASIYITISSHSFNSF